MKHDQKKRSIAFRLEPRTVTHLKRRAEEARATQTALAERYIEEGLRQDEHPLIYFREGEAGRRPAVVGSRLSVADIVTTVRQNANSVADTAEYLGLPVEHVDAALRYYVDYTEEVDAWIERSHDATERERERWRRRQEALG